LKQLRLAKHSRQWIIDLVPNMRYKVSDLCEPDLVLGYHSAQTFLRRLKPFVVTLKRAHLLSIPSKRLLVLLLSLRAFAAATPHGDQSSSIVRLIGEIGQAKFNRPREAGTLQLDATDDTVSEQDLSFGLQFRTLSDPSLAGPCGFRIRAS
jgi:hypothetical protein